jgi:hypothetical protein
MGRNNAKNKLVREAVWKFNQFPSRSIARYILAEYGGLFNNSLDNALCAVRYVRGKKKGGSDKFTPDNRVISPPDNIQIPETWRRIDIPYQLGEGKWLILADAHIPFHERKPLEEAIKYGKKISCTGIFMNGDMQDCQAVSYWPSVIRKNFMGEVNAVVEFFAYLKQQFPKRKKVYKPGNHEYRLPRFYAAQCPDLINSPLAAMESLLDFERWGIEFLDYFQIVMAGKLPILHGHEIRMISRVVNPARGLALKAKTWALCSHFHTTSEHTGTNLKGEYLTTWSTGCLCDLHPEFCKYGNDWNQGFAIIEVDRKGDFEVQNKRILPGGKVV